MLISNYYITNILIVDDSIKKVWGAVCTWSRQSNVCNKNKAKKKKKLSKANRCICKISKYAYNNNYSNTIMSDTTADLL